MARESSRLPTSARPKVSSRPVESAMQNDANCRFAVRMNRAPSVWEDMNAEILQAAPKGCATYLKARGAEPRICVLVAQPL